MKTKILHIITSLGNGGAERVLYNLVTNSDTKQFEHVVVSIKDKGVYGDLLTSNGIKVHTLNINKRKPWSVFKIFKIFKDENPDMIQSWLYHADFLTILLYLRGYRNIFWNIRNNTLKWSISSKMTILCRKICAWFSFVPQKIICCANAAMEEHIRVGYSQNKFLIIPNGYDLNLFQPNNKIRQQLRKDLNICEHDFVIGSVGRDDPAKDRPTLLQSLKKLSKQNKNIKLLLIGANINKENSQLIEMIKQYWSDNNIILLEQQQHIHLYYNVMDLFILSSQAEAFPNVLAEAMATGLPCITTDAGDARNIVEDTELVVPIGDYVKLSSIADKIINLKDSERLQIGNKLLCRVRENYSIQAMVKSYEGAYINNVKGLKCQKNF